MRNVTDLALQYLEAKRHLWNVYFVDKVRSLHKSSPLDTYEMIDRLLFSGLCLEPLNQEPMENHFRFGLDPFPFLRVVPKDGIEKLPVRVSEPHINQNRVWAPAVLILAKGTEFAFIEFFDWNRYGYVSYPYYKAKVTKCPEFPEYEEREGLIEVKDADIFFSKRK